MGKRDLARKSSEMVVLRGRSEYEEGFCEGAVRLGTFMKERRL